MVYNIRIEQELKEKIYAGNEYCAKCGDFSDFHLYSLQRTGRIFSIPICSATIKRFTVCDRCGAARELTKSEFKSREKQQIEKLKNNEFPPDIVERDCNPQKVKWERRIIKLILSGYVALTIPFTMIMALSGMSAEEILHDLMSGASILLPAFALSCLPFAISLKNYIIARRKKKAYKFLHKSI